MAWVAIGRMAIDRWPTASPREGEIRRCSMAQVATPTKCHLSTRATKAVNEVKRKYKVRATTPIPGLALGRAAPKAEREKA